MSDSNRPASQDGNQAGGTRFSSGGARQKIFNIVGWLAFALLLPPVLAMFKLPQLQVMITGKIGSWGSPVALVAYFYIILESTLKR